METHFLILNNRHLGYKNVNNDGEQKNWGHATSRVYGSQHTIVRRRSSAH